MVLAALTSIAIAAVGAATLGAVAGSDQSPLLSDAPPQGIVVEPEHVVRDAQYVVGLKISRAEPMEILIEATGVVTSSSIDVGMVVRSGTRLVSVNDHPIVGMVAPAPLYRDLSPGDDGMDVTRLQKFLSDTGYYKGPLDGEIGTRTHDAIRAWNGDHGRSGGVFLRSSVAWVGPANLELAAVTTRVGDRVASGTAVAQGPSPVIRISVEEPADGVGAGPHRLRVGSVEVPYDSSVAAITNAEDVRAISNAMGSDEGAGQVVTVGEPVLSIPATAVITDNGGTVCVFPDTESPAVEVTPTGGGGGMVFLPETTELETVLANPTAVRSHLSCDS